MSSDTVVECDEVSGKSIRTLKIYRDPLDGTEVQIDFMDGTSLSICVVNHQKADANLVICGGPGEPELVKKYNLD